MATFVTVVLLAAAIAAVVYGRRVWRAKRLPPAEPLATTLALRYEVGAARGSPDWQQAMQGVGERLRGARVSAVVFVHGTFAGDDPLSAIAAVERALPQSRPIARSLRRATRTVVDKVLGDIGNFGTAYARTFEEAVGPGIACTPFTWSSENHHVGRLQGALDLVRVLATHAELAGAGARILVLGHSHAGQVFALVTQLVGRTIAAEAIRDVARARALDLSALDTDLARLEGVGLDFVTFGSPARYAWADVPGVRALHVVHARGDAIRRLGVPGSDLPALAASDRRINAALDDVLGPGFAPGELARGLVAEGARPNRGDVALVDYGDERLTDVLSTGFGHAMYTRLDAMLFHAELVVSRFYAAPPPPPRSKAASRVADLLRSVKQLGS